MTVVWIALAGGLGASLRYVIERSISQRWPKGRSADSLPWALLIVNVSGSGALGIATGACLDHSTMMILGTGLLGGYTTLSGASVDTAQRLLHGQPRGAALSAGLMMIASVGAGAAGVAVGSTFC